MNAKFHFGKYRGRQIEEIRLKDPGYIAWAIENVAGFRQIAEASAISYTPPKKRKGSKKSSKAKEGDLFQSKPSKPYKASADKPAKKWKEWIPPNPDVIGDAIRAEPVLAYLMPNEMHMDSGFDVMEANHLTDVPW